MTQRRVLAVTLALAALGFGRIGQFHFISEPLHEQPIPGPTADGQFLPLLPLLPRSGEVGYVSDEPILLAPGHEFQGAKQRFLQLQYAIAPVVLRYGDDRAPLVIANVGDPAHLQPVLAEHGLVMLAQTSPVTALARPR